jgi:DNA-binding NarL/FixJ family response regulator
MNNPLTDRQMEIVQGIVDGLSYKMIGLKLNISLDTVRTHIMQIYRTLNINCKSQLIKWALENKI